VEVPREAGLGKETISLRTMIAQSHRIRSLPSFRSFLHFLSSIHLKVGSVPSEHSTFSLVFHFLSQLPSYLHDNEIEMAACGGIRMIEFFSGIGGMRYAVENSIKQSKSSWSLTSCQAYDISLHANNTYRQNFPHDTSPVCTKLVEQLKPKDLDGKADLWTMSPPCQPFTTTRGSKSLDKEDKRCNGFKGIITLLTEIQDKPKYILLENVKGFSTSQMIQEWYACLHQNGYSYKQYLVSPVQIGIPNHRQRCYILCERSDRWKDATEIEQDIVIPAEEPNRKQQQHVVGDYLDTSLSDEGLKDYLVPDSVLQKDWARQVGVVANMDRATHCFTAGYGRIFHRATGSLLLLRAPEDSLAESPLDRSDMMKYSNRLRRFTPKELLALFGFPRTFEFPEGSNLGQQYKLIGNSINVTVVTFLMKELLFGQTESTESLSVGGTKGHVSEEIQGNLLQLYQNYRWKMIPNCTGRHTCRDHDKVSSVPPLELLRRIGIEKKCKGSTTKTTNGDYELKEYHFELPERADKVCVIPLDTDNETGIITFIKEERTAFIHTLNTPSGFRRKLARIGITVSTDDVLIDDGFQSAAEL
jgi:tRNA (cytosine38-C5)-methyltransferase